MSSTQSRSTGYIGPIRTKIATFSVGLEPNVTEISKLIWKMKYADEENNYFFPKNHNKM